MKVYLHVYDLSNGLAKQLSPMILQQQIDGIWHTGVVVDGVEYYYGGGIQRGPAGQTPFGAPLQKLELGETEIPLELRESYLEELGSSAFRPADYKLLSNNCNNFSNEFSIFLTGHGIPEHIVSLPDQVMSSPQAAALMPFLQSMESNLAQAQQQQGLYIGQQGGHTHLPAPAQQQQAAGKALGGPPGSTGAYTGGAAGAAKKSTGSSGPGPSKEVDRMDPPSNSSSQTNLMTPRTEASLSKGQLKAMVREEFDKLMAAGTWEKNAAAAEAMKLAVARAKRQQQQ